MDNNEIDAADGRFAKGLKWLGIALIIMGFLAIVFPLATTIAAKIFIGWLLIISGAFQMWQSFSVREWGGFLWNLLIGLLYLVVGCWLAFDPFAGIIGLTVLLAITFIAQGAMEAAMASKLRPNDGWGWMMFSGLIGIAVGVLIIAELPSTAAWAVGLMVGINMITSGFAFLTLGSAAQALGGDD
ncbi:MAG: HdeD family acid-resistance protein [Paracoccaceae bacterium]